MIKSGAFDSLGIERKQSLKNMDDILKFINAMKKKAALRTGQFALWLSAPTISLKLKPARPRRTGKNLSWEKELIGFFISEHPLNALAEKIAYYKCKPIGGAYEHHG